MSEIVTEPQEPQTPPVAAAPPPAEQAPPAPEPEDPTAGLDSAEEKLQALHGALTTARANLRELKPLAQRAQQLEAEVAELREIKPYGEFLKANPHLLQSPKPQEPLPPRPEDDPVLVEKIARPLDLYDAQTGKPDVRRAEIIRQLIREEAKAIAREEIAPFQATTWQQQAEMNQQAIRGLKDASGTPVDGQFVEAAINAVSGSLPEGERQRVMADSKVASLIGAVALGLQAAYKKPAPAAPQPPQHPPLEVESAGGQSQMTLSEGSKRLAKMTGKTEAEWQESAKKYKAGRSNVLE